MNVWLLVSTNIYFFYKDYLCFLSDHSRYIYYSSKPWGCVYMYVCNDINFLGIFSKP